MSTWTTTGIGTVAKPGITPADEVAAAIELGRAGLQTPYADAVLSATLLRFTDQQALLAQVHAGAALVTPAVAEPGHSWRSASSVLFEDGTLTGVKDPVPWLAEASHGLVLCGRMVYLIDRLPSSGSALTLDRTPATDLSIDRAGFDGALNRGTLALCAETLGAMEAALALAPPAPDLFINVQLAKNSVEYAATALSTDDPGSAEESAVVARTKLLVIKSARLVAQSISRSLGRQPTAQSAVAHLVDRMGAFEETWGAARQHGANVARSMAD